MAPPSFSTTSLVAIACCLFTPSHAVPALRPRPRATASPFDPIDPQKWVNPDNMTWADYKQPPGTTWGDPSRQGRERNFNIALVTVDYPDSPFVVTLEPHSDLFTNPQPEGSNLKREDVPSFYGDFLNKPNELNGGHTLHEYWMGDSFGKYGVNLTVFGPYRMPRETWRYGIDDEDFNEGACPNKPCSVNLRTDALGAWRRDVGNATARTFELAFILSAGQDESSTWQEFGEMKFASPQDVPKEFGPPGNSSLPNYAKTRYVSWTSWASAATIWPNAGGGSSTQGESSGLGTFAHELSHLLGIGDNYNNPYGDPPRRSYTGPFSMLSRGSFNGPGGPHTRWQIPPRKGGSMGCLHTMRDKHQIQLIDSTPILQISRNGLPLSGPVVAELTARSVDPGTGLMGFNISFGSNGDLQPRCDITTDPLCDGGSFNNYNIEVVDRMGADSFVPDSGVMLSKTKDSDEEQPFQWIIDANPQDAHVIDFYYPNGTARYWSIGDYRQLVDALFHAGTNSGSQFEYRDDPNGLHFYIIGRRRDAQGVLKYTVGVASTIAGVSGNSYNASLSEGVLSNGTNATAADGTYCTFTITNTGNAAANASSHHPQDLSAYLGHDIYRLNATVEGKGWKVGVPNALATAKFGESVEVKVAVGMESGYGASAEAVVTLSVGSESDGRVKGRSTCKVKA